MLCVYDPDCTDFSGNGFGTISPSSALVKENNPDIIACQISGDTP